VWGGGGRSSGASFLQAERASALARVTAIAILFMVLSLLMISSGATRLNLQTHSRQDRSPSRIRRADRGRQAALVPAGQIDLPDGGFTRIALRAEELHDPAVGRPGRRFVLPAIGEMAQTAPIGAHHGD